MSLVEYDSEKDTRLHIVVVRAYLMKCCGILEERGLKHDKSKLEEPEKSFFDKYTPLLASLDYGSDEYKQALARLQPALQHHYEANSHHPEHYGYWMCLGACGKKFKTSEVSVLCPNCGCSLHNEVSQIDGMNLFDVIEMLMDWKAASERHANGDIRASMKINKKRFGISDQLASILNNTIKIMGW